ncbi:hypothetical protein B0T21DRAFT_450498 [Apiosordaria backusii]|uniref:Ecp2 effector protein domain-containing protein n=1 Tax=Apiosordaria backusii TaxID=314023 RepID=A0AA40EEX3_9PEZI|nr:hypothetical protein B0T21DRAFT_450498 [Apiosordaria backusii]
MRVLHLLSLCAAAYAAAVSPELSAAPAASPDHPYQQEFTNLLLNPANAHPEPSPFNITALLNLAAAAPNPIDLGPHWPLPIDKIECDTTHAYNNKYAFVWALVRTQIEWIREEGPKYWRLDESMQNGQILKIGCCNEAAFVIVAQRKDKAGNPVRLGKTIMVSGAEITTMGMAVADACRQGDFAKGRAWSRYRDFTVEVFHDDYKCGRKCWQGD